MEVSNNSIKVNFKSDKKPNILLKFLLYLTISIILFLTGYFSRDLFPIKDNPIPTKSIEQVNKPQSVVQLDILNGCGVNGVATKFTDFLRSNGYDVVEIKNYKTFQISHTMVIDRIGNFEQARNIADVLGVSENNIIQQINADYFVDVSVIIGKDYLNLQPLN